MYLLWCAGVFTHSCLFQWDSRFGVMKGENWEPGRNGMRRQREAKPGLNWGTLTVWRKGPSGTSLIQQSPSTSDSLVPMHKCRLGPDFLGSSPAEKDLVLLIVTKWMCSNLAGDTRKPNGSSSGHLKSFLKPFRKKKELHVTESERIRYPRQQ